MQMFITERGLQQLADQLVELPHIDISLQIEAAQQVVVRQALLDAIRFRRLVKATILGDKALEAAFQADPPLCLDDVRRVIDQVIKSEEGQ